MKTKFSSGENHRMTSGDTEIRPTLDFMILGIKDFHAGLVEFV